MLTRLSAFLLAALALSGAAAAHAAGPKPGPVAYVILETRDFRVEIAGDRARDRDNPRDPEGCAAQGKVRLRSVIGSPGRDGDDEDIAYHVVGSRFGQEGMWRVVGQGVGAASRFLWGGNHCPNRSPETNLRSENHGSMTAFGHEWLVCSMSR